MISVSANNGLKFIFQFAWKLGVVHYFPTTTKSGQLSISLTHSKLRTQTVKLTTIIVCLYITFIVFRAYEGLTSGKIPARLGIKFIVKMMYLTLAYGYSAIVQINAWKNWEEIPIFLKNFFNFFKIGNKGKLEEIALPPVTKYIVTPLLIGFGVTLLNVFVILIKPQLPQLLTSLLDNPKYASNFKKVPFYLVHIYIWTYTWVSFKYI